MVGKKGEVNLTQYSMIADALQSVDNKFCKINFSVQEYDKTNGSALFHSLRHGKSVV